jgi:hypothetical protein
MAKEWILNSATNRFQFNFKRNVGATSEAIRACAPKNLKEWEKYYFDRVRPKKHIIELGKKLYIKITEVIPSEIEAITEKDCIDYITDLVIKKTFEGYDTERKTVYGQLQDILNVEIEPAPDEWDRKFNVDFFIKIKNKYIGLQIKPASGASHISQIFKERNLQEKTHRKFSEKHGGAVFYVISVKDGESKKIYNQEVIGEIKKEIKRLSK